MPRRRGVERGIAPRCRPALDRRLVRPREPYWRQPDMRARQPECPDARRGNVEARARLHRTAYRNRDRAVRRPIAAGKGIRSAKRVSARPPGKTIVLPERHRRAEAFEWIATTRPCGSTTAARDCCC